tara:strand:+ start:8768 stop:11005 length:2238 start_codon:yes stop_codon:yes gene_type:complete
MSSTLQPFNKELKYRAKFFAHMKIIFASRRFAIVVVVTSIFFGLATYSALTGAVSAEGADPLTILILLNVDLVLLLVLGALLALRVNRLWNERRQGSIGSRLHSRMLILFGLVAATPAVVVAVFSISFFNFGLEAWFNERVVTAFQRSRAVASAYIKDHQEFIKADVLSIAAAINRTDAEITTNFAHFSKLLNSLADERSVSEAIVIRRDGKVLASTKLSFLLTFDSLSNNFLEQASRGEIIIATSDSSDRVRALARLDNIPGTFVYIGRFVDREVLEHLERVTVAVNEYEALQSKSSNIQIIFTLLYLLVALLLLFAAIWIGMMFANRLVREISDLVVAAEKVRAGDLTARVSEGVEGDEIGSLNRAFNRMTSQLQRQRKDLISANQQLDERRRFTEAVLLGVSSGVIGLDENSKIFIPNRAALDLLTALPTELIGSKINNVLPEFMPLMENLRNSGQTMVQDQIRINRKGRVRTLLVRLNAQKEQHTTLGYVVTFDDITELVNAQRAAAWSDVARRIAHEIKNPLTPIQLSAERLKRKFLSDIDKDKDIFAMCTDTIVRQVSSIRSMVDEFSTFARMPAPIRERVNISELIKGVVSMHRLATPHVEFTIGPMEDEISVSCDHKQFTQAINNLILNAVDAVEHIPDFDGSQKKIDVKLFRIGKTELELMVEDNGCGLPKELIDRLVEPYITTREKGTGLGLAIVKKIIEDHGGVLNLKDRAGGGASISLRFPIDTMTGRPISKL